MNAYFFLVMSHVWSQSGQKLELCVFATSDTQSFGAYHCSEKRSGSVPLLGLLSVVLPLAIARVRDAAAFDIYDDDL